MKWIRPGRTEWISFLATLPVVAVILPLLLFGQKSLNDPKLWFLAVPFILLLALAAWYLQVLVMYRLRERFTQIRHNAYRLLLLALAHLCLLVTFNSFLFWFFSFAGYPGYVFGENSFGLALLFGGAVVLINTSLWEADYSMKKWKQSLAEKEKLEQLTIQLEFDTLKNQVNPHFLFNCFNTLSSLISEDPRQAEVFLNELSKVYRYLLRNNENDVSCLADELRFTDSYYRLLQTRYGQAVQINMVTDKKFNDYLLPSLTLQMLVENAVKHNMMSRQEPLVIDIFTTAGNMLVVSNNLRLRTVKAPSNRIGLENIRSKYRLLSNQQVQILTDESRFTVVMPLVWNKFSEKHIQRLKIQS